MTTTRLQSANQVEACYISVLLTEGSGGCDNVHTIISLSLNTLSYQATVLFQEILKRTHQNF